MAVKCKIRLMLFAKGDAKKGFGVVLTDRPMYYFVKKPAGLPPKAAGWLQDNGGMNDR
jgi:hypothetical protein